MFKRFLTLASASLLASCTTAQADTPQLASTTAATPIAHTTGAVSAADPRAAEAGMEMLRQGGSATDAAIATMLALNVVEPQSSGIGGGGFLVRGAADGSVETLDGRETAPSAAGSDWFLGADGKPIDFREAVNGGLSIGVPGNVALAAEAHKRHGKLAWSVLFKPAIRLARDGFRINPRLHDYISGDSTRASSHPGGKALFYDAEGEPLPLGALVKNPELAQTFERIAQSGSSAFYEGAFAETMASEIRTATPSAAGMTAQDVAAYRAKERAPVCGTYRGYRICGMGPPSSGGIAVLQMLGQLERFDLAALGPENPLTWHLFLESQRLAYADRELYLADSDFVPVPVEGLVDPAYIASRSALIDRAKSIGDVQPGTPAGASLALADGDEPAESGTSHFAVVDDAGTMISYTSTIEGPFGSGLLYGGFYLNNELTDFSFAPEIGGKPVANRVEGGKRPRSSMAPTVIWDPQGRPVLAIGAAGGSTIPVQTARAIIGVVDFKLPVEFALGLPLIMGFGDTVIVEKGTWLEQAIPQFQALGHANIRAATPPLKAGAVLRTANG